MATKPRENKMVGNYQEERTITVTFGLVDAWQIKIRPSDVDAAHDCDEYEPMGVDSHNARGGTINTTQ